MVIGAQRQHVHPKHVAQKDAHNRYKVARIEGIRQAQHHKKGIHTYHESPHAKPNGYGHKHLSHAQTGAVNSRYRSHQHHQYKPKHIDQPIVVAEKKF